MTVSRFASGSRNARTPSSAPKTRDVPCNGCTQCCHDEMVFLHPEMGDDAGTYHTRTVINPITKLAGQALMQDANGACIYLGPSGCTIHARRPAICRAFDCKALYERLAETFGLRDLGAVVARSRTLQIGEKRSRGVRP